MEDVNYSLLALNKNTEYSRLVAEMYIPAISNVLDLYLKVIQNITSYYGVTNTFLLLNEGYPNQKKTITLSLIDESHHPAVHALGSPPVTYKTIQKVSSSKYLVVLMEETEGNPETSIAVIEETQLKPVVTIEPELVEQHLRKLKRKQEIAGKKCN